ncbi:MAG: DUF3619 family protein [Betaproteobacteria bacterium]|nr:DUF3619 family protein [Betaproteobacteria bacterium]
MTANEQYFAEKIAGYLDRGNDGLKAGTAYKLQQARAQALARLAEREHAPGMTLAGAHGLAGGPVADAAGRSRHPHWASRGLWIGIALIIAGSVAFQQWQATQQVQELEETDAAILSSDLPIDAYLDRGFQNWLKHVAE